MSEPTPAVTAVLSEKREAAAKALREILDRMGIEAEVSAFDDGERIFLDAHGAESGLIIGKKGATLDALQYIVNRTMDRASSLTPRGTVAGAKTRWSTWRAASPTKRSRPADQCRSSR
jgi:predicted RNA-binding protein Jag